MLWPGIIRRCPPHEQHRNMATTKAGIASAMTSLICRQISFKLGSLTMVLAR